MYNFCGTNVDWDWAEENGHAHADWCLRLVSVLQSFCDLKLGGVNSVTWSWPMLDGKGVAFAG